jgi:hypothetical protein
MTRLPIFTTALRVQSRLFSNSTIPRYPPGDQMTAQMRWKPKATTGQVAEVRGFSSD